MQCKIAWIVEMEAGTAHKRKYYPGDTEGYHVVKGTHPLFKSILEEGDALAGNDIGLADWFR